MAGKEEIKKKVIEVLKNIYDPEIPIDIWNLGLIYKVDVDDGGIVRLKMTLTAPGCPVANMIVYQVMDAIQNVDGVRDVDVELVFDPPWDPTKMTPEGREKFKQVFGYDVVEEYMKQKELMSGQ